ncbi:MAG: helix-turn-helix transcriptional regulator [Intestinibacter sp.]
MKDINSDEIFNVIGQNVKYYRKLYNLNKGKMTQENLAELVDVSTALIGNLESEKISQGISVVTLWKISQALEVPIEKLFDYSNLKKKTS